MNRRRIVPHRSPVLEITPQAPVVILNSEDSTSDVARALKHYVLHGHERYIKDISPRVQAEITSMAADAINAHAATRDLTFSSDQIQRIRNKQSLYPKDPDPVVTTAAPAFEPKRPVGRPIKEVVTAPAPEASVPVFSFRASPKQTEIESLFLQSAVEIGFTNARRILDKLAEGIRDLGHSS